MKVLIVGSGGRCHALAWKIKHSPLLKELFVAPGNGGMKDIATLVPIDVLDNESLLKFAIDNQIDLTIVGPETSLMNGICDLFKEKGLKIFGPTKDAALIEGSKEFAKDIMTKYLIPTAKYESFDDYEEALAYVEREGTPTVINSWRKPIGLPMG